MRKIWNWLREYDTFVFFCITLLLIIIFVIPLFFTSCTCGFGGGGFSLEGFFGNPIIIFLIIALIVWAYLRSKKQS